MKSENHWLDWAKELQFIAQSALTYCKDPFDIERFERVRGIAAEMMSEIADMPLERVRDLFCSEKGYQTPKLDTRAAVIRDGKIALVQERDGLWAMHGGWCDYNQSVRANTEKEALEEAGMTVRVTRVVALFDHNRRNLPPSGWEICTALLLCEYVGGSFAPNTETTACEWFAPDDLPPLNVRKTNADQIRLAFQAQEAAHWETIVD